ncbi:MAG: ATPase, T2SS/T4P/T4SS family [Desulfovibrionales bacterium]|nr:ATPase, T2SS/T4P/T4SS family [Desulfovibrionales bacterium]
MVANPDAGSAVITSNKVVVRFLDGRMIKGRCLSFNQQNPVIKVESIDRSSSCDLKWDDLKAVFFVREFEGLARPADDSVQLQASSVSSVGRHVQVEFVDGEVIQGYAEALKTGLRGFFISPLNRRDNNLRIFVPKTAIKNVRVAPKLGETMVKEGMLGKEDLSDALKKQTEYRAQKLGEVAIKEGMAAAEEVERALKVQKTVVGQKIGEILVEAGVLTREDLERALSAQKENRSKKLGQILLEMNLATPESLALALALKYRLPYVDVSTYPVDPVAVTTVKEEVARRLQFIPINKTRDTLTIAIADPINFAAKDYIQSTTGLNIKEVLSTPESIEEAVKQYFGAPALDDEIQRLSEVVAAEKGETDDKMADLIQQVEEASIVKLVNGIIRMAVAKRASDIHINPERRSTVISYRIDGILRQEKAIDEYIHPILISRIKIMGNMNIAERRLPQDGRARLRVGEKLIDLRISSIPTIWGESIVIRVLEKSASVIGLEDLGFFPDDLGLVRSLISRPYGMLLITGPTGSGKSTTVYSLLQEPVFKGKNIITIEDPVEYELPNVNQIQVKPHINLTFAKALRQILRHDPDVIMVGEIRDAETARIAIQAALTGHLLISTLHTNNAPETLSRLMDMGIEPYLLSSTVLGVISQRLARTICKSPECRQVDTKAPESLAAAGLAPEKYQGHTFYKGKGCKDCTDGYKGRTIIYEFMRINEPIKRAIVEKVSTEEIRALSRANGMRTMAETALLKAKEGITTVEEVFTNLIE